VNYGGALHDWDALTEKRPAIAENIFPVMKIIIKLFHPGL